MSALETVAWRYRTKSSAGQWSMWVAVSEDPSSENYEFEAVHLTPLAPAQAEIERLKVENAATAGLVQGEMMNAEYWRDRALSAEERVRVLEGLLAQARPFVADDTEATTDLADLIDAALAKNSAVTGGAR